MVKQVTQGYPVMIIGAGVGGHALLEMFLEESLAQVIAIADLNTNAPGIQLAKSYGIPTFSSATEALQSCQHYKDCIVYNLSQDDSVNEAVIRVFGDHRAASGPEVKLFWQIVMNLKETKNALEKSQNQLQAIIHNAMDGIITLNEAGDIQGFNPAAVQIFGYTPDEISGKNIRMLLPEQNGGDTTSTFRCECDPQHKSVLPEQNGGDTTSTPYLHTDIAKIAGESGREVIAVKKGGEEFSMEISVSEMMLGGERYFIGIARDITQRKLAEQKIAHLAHHDYLTDLPNRALFLNKLEQSVLLAKRNNYKVGVLFLDLDGFKQVNDTQGHDIGDLLLQAVSQRLKGIIRASDTFARVGGDEFTFVLNNIESDRNASIIAEKIILALSEPFLLKDKYCRIGGSIGISLFPDSATDIEKLIKQADQAMYLAKQSDKNNYKFYRDIG